MPYLHQLDPIAVALGPLKVHWYGLMYLLAFFVAWWLGRKRIRAGYLPGVNEVGYGDLMFYGMVGVILGGRIGYVLFYDLQTYISHPLQILRVWEGGMSFHGGLAGVIIATWIWARKHHLHFFDVGDFIAPLVPPGLGFGRLGNFINGELWGKPTDAAYGVIFPSALPAEYARMDAVSLKHEWASGALNSFARHPSQLYQAFLEGVVLFLVLWFLSKRERPRYFISGVFLALYGVFRFIVEFVRVPDAQIGDHGYLAFGWLTMGQVLSVPLILAGIALVVYSRRAPVLHRALPEASA
ncbi:prolipoprotein diacylglyceryl transferase [Lysobacter sp. HDW10]|jgi:phosphatidylglycerol:prolipoprotein diacylglycerol transferase|uniref:prolipoprotein diacylglyceryl transferase n=1 Tax=Lysobacter sp. HDW10 TaxID=2714936 RepID=UPI00140811F8|nr:prolipoprotein diacylglyceryl transferase [Lysobacter sp. HDW10]QIK81186.1 prolipoprotein diacylglyceryl transferase [Lysobacter sp. HDW10]